MLTALWLAAATASAQDIWPADAEINDALRLQMTPQGLAAAAGIADALVPSDPFAIPYLSGGGGASFCLFAYSYAASNGWVAVEVVNASIVPSNGVLTLNASLRVEVNSAFDPMVLDLEAACISGDCDVHLNPFLVEVTAPINLQVVNGQIRATIGQVSFTDDLTGDDVNITACTAASIVNTIQGFYDVYGLLVNYARDQVTDLIPGLIADFQPAIDDALAVAAFNNSFDLLGTTLYVDFRPTGVVVTPSGVDIKVGGSVYADPAACVADLDPGGSRASSAAAPSITTLPGQTHVGVRASTDIVDQGLYAIWRGGLLCQDITGGALGGFTLDTGLLGIVGGDSYAALFPEAKPISLRTVPKHPPQVVANPAHDLAVAIEDLDVEIYAELEGRQARVLALSVSPEVGLDVGFNNTTGSLAINLALPATYNAQLIGDRMVPDADEVVANVEGLVSTVAATALTGALGDSLSFNIPAFQATGGNFGLRNLAVTGTAGGWTTAEASVGTVSYAGAGCEDGCTGGSGCAAAPGASFTGAGGLLALLLLRRRR